ncbi:GNAT family N-acetyltransferase [Flavivirga abyssicola]|uniref:GNAT family N-acetyltransferase n=1 Tax=Flavivirga abyssicola TaxID=3063533 RepID=UPI0026DF7ACB|nr:GNAT family N-acetyltransferase [Flavivirga sp. MEBiC07777]WVK12977.1 GNAT family N-acetyltransferase [Flavivirga sp. MEBiC07777]
MEIKRYDSTQKTVWDEFIPKSKNGVFLFYREYLDYHKDRFTDHSLIILKKNKIIALFPANENNNQILSHGGLTFGSLIMSHDVRATEVLNIFLKIKEYYKELKFTDITYKAVPSIFHKYPSEEDLYALFRINAKLIRRDISSVVKISNKIRFSESKRQAVTKCIKNEAIVSKNNDFGEYWDLLTSVLAKFDTKPVHTLGEINSLKESFPDNIKLFEARKDNILLAGIVVYDFGNVIHTQYMANSQDGRKIGALDFINDSLINEVYKDRDFYSFGISTENQGRVLNEGLIQQKEMMGSRGIAVDFYNISL